MAKRVLLFMLAATLVSADGPVLKTGQTQSYYAGDDGTYQKGLPRSYSRTQSGVVKDLTTGLEWQDEMVNDNNISWHDAQTYCKGLQLDGGGWRLPTIREWRTIVDASQGHPAVDPVFLNMQGNVNYWCETTAAWDSGRAWYVFSQNAVEGINSKTATDYASVTEMNVRCVRESGVI